MIFSLIFSISVSMLFFISGISKMLSLKQSASSIVKLELLPKKLATIIGFSLPFLEIVMSLALLLKGNSIIINIAMIGLIVVLIIINFRAINEGKQSDCFCLGKIVNTKIGYGGLIQCILLLLSLIPNIINESINFLEIQEMQLLQIIFIFITAFLWVVSMIIIRKLIEITYNTTGDIEP